MVSNGGWIGVDLDGTLAQYHGWNGTGEIGPPVKEMLDRVKGWLSQGVEVRIFTARVYHDWDGVVTAAIEKWCEKYVGRKLPVTCEKDFSCMEIWDDRAVGVIPNTGIRCDGKP